jgi:RHS repeat-associated protein
LVSVKEGVQGGPDNTQYYYDGRAFAYGRGHKQYELTNHLGNVLATISDRKFGVSSAGSSLIDHYEPDIVTAQDYYPFGMMSRVALPNSGVPYKFGFNGQEMNNDVKGGLGNSYTAQYWEYDSRIGRRWNLDPKPTVGFSPYRAFANNPILFSDPLGDTTVPAAAGVGNVDIDEKSNSLDFYKAGAKYYMSGTKTSVPVSPGQLRSFTNSLGTFTAKWVTLTDGVVGFDGYLNDQGKTFEQAATEFLSSFQARVYTLLNNTGNSINKAITNDQLGFSLKVGTGLIVNTAFMATEPQPYSGNYRPNETTLEGVGGIELYKGSQVIDRIGFGLNAHLYDFSNATGYKDYTQFTFGNFNPSEIQAAIENPYRKIGFNLQDFSMSKYLKYAKNPVAPSPLLNNVSNWELHLIKNTPGAMDRTTFFNFKNGIYQTVPNPF